MRGFSVAEIIVVLAILGSIMALSFTPLRQVATVRTAADAARTYGYALTDARQRASAMQNDTAWGVRLASTSVTVFSGASYAARTASRDRSFSIPSGLTVSGPTEVVFAKLSGAPNATGTTTIGNGVATSTVVIGNGGAIQFAL